MTEALGNFIRVLRAADVRVSTAETIDAMAAIEAIGVADRPLLRSALAQVLAKTPEDKERFGDCFDRFFRFEDMERLAGAEPAEEAIAALPGEGGVPGAAGPGAGGAGGGEGGVPELLGLLEAGDVAALQLRMADAARWVRLSNIRLFTQRGMYTRRILEHMGIEPVEDAIADAARDGRPPAEARAARLRALRARLVEEVRELVERQMLLYTANSGQRLREEILQRTPLARVEVRDFKVMQGLVRKLTKRLIALHSRRRRVARRGQLDVRRTIRRNIEFDGLLFETVWKKTKVDRPRVIAVCDVSGSVAAVARFLLLFLYSVTEVIPKVRAFAFSNQLVEVTRLFAAKKVEDAVAETLFKYSGGSTDYGGALASLAEQVLDDVDHRTTVLILGDARSNYGDPGDAHLRRIHERARRVIWLNPEPRSFWDTGDSEMRRLGAACDRVEPCRSLRHLERIVSEIMRSAV